MSENHIELKSVNELLNMNFFIPNYQRGYRWTTQQVKDLLNDVNEFCPKHDDFYCIQPLVVKRKEDDIFRKIKDEAKSLEEIEKLLKGFSWEVIDGQQRLTTILIILSCLGMNSPYRLEYETRKGIENCVNGETDNEDNIDFYHVSQAKKTITDWLNEKDHKEEFKEKLLNRVKFIWYQTDDTNPIKVFTRLNIGKISLTNAELIKALFLNSSNFGEEYNSTVRLRQQEIAAEWDRIEYTLQNNDFWLFLNNVGYEKPTRIDILFDIIRRENPKQDSIGDSDEYATFRYFYENFKNNKEYMNEVWSEVRQIFETFKEWFNDVLLYHYVGYLIICGVRIDTLLDEWKNNCTKNNFIENYLRETIKKKIEKCKELNKQYEIDGADPKTTCRPLLLLHNVQTAVNQAEAEQKAYHLQSFYKFPFHLYKTEKWDVEHIDSNTSNALDNDKDKEEWLKYSLLYDQVENDNTLKSKIVAYIEKVNNDDNFDEIKEAIEKLVGNATPLNDREKNQIWNFVLLDSSTNRSYGNSIFPVKRRCIIEKDRGKKITIDKQSLTPKEEDSKSAFIPPCTKYAFLKYYNSASASILYWDKRDAEAYRDNILKTLEEFNVYCSQEEK